MAIVRKCDVCKKSIESNGIAAGTLLPYKSFELCKTHGAPILKVLKKYKLTT